MNKGPPLHLKFSTGSIITATSGLCVAVGFMVILGWAFDIQAFKGISPQWISMKANTALCFILLGLAFWQLRKDDVSVRSRFLARACATMVSLVALLTLGEIAFHADFGIDQLLFKEAPSSVYTPGQMAPSTAFCFTAAGAALLLLTSSGNLLSRTLPLVMCASGLIVLVGLIAILGHVSGITIVWPWKNLTAMAIHTAVLLVTFGCSLMAAAWRAEPMKKWALGGWETAAFTGGLALMCCMFIVSYRTVSDMDATARWFAHTHEVRFQISSVLDELKDIDIGARNYILNNQERLLRQYMSASKSITGKLDELRKLTADNPAQQQRIRKLEPLTTAKLDFAANAIAARQSQVIDVAVAMVHTLKGQELSEEITRILEAMDADEALLLKQRQSESDAAVDATFVMLPVAVLFSLGILVTVLLLLNGEASERQRAENEVRTLNAELEERIHNRTAQLEASNKELEAFSYTVAHDLRAPLRAVDGFSRMLAEDYSAKLDAEGNRRLKIVSSEARRMGQLVDDLLAFSRLGRVPMKYTAIDMTALAREVFESSAKAERPIQGGAPPRLELKDLPPARGDPAMLRQVFANVIDNAIKFSSKSPAPVIEIGGTSGVDETTYSIKDNGVGFDMKYYDKLFTVFQRLHHESEFEGNGVGLALVQRIVHRHGGRVWAEGKVGGGATFNFTLPKEPKEKEFHS